METKKRYDHLVKLVMVGDAGIGKSSLLSKFTSGAFNQNYLTTVGVDLLFTTVEVEQKRVRFQLWDTAGAERFRSITASFYRGAHVIIVAFDVTNGDSYMSLPRWISEARRYKNSECDVILVATKADDDENRQVDSDHILALETTYGIPCVETSAKSSKNVNELFDIIAHDQMKKKEEERKGIEKAKSEKRKITLTLTRRFSSFACCS